MEGFSSNHFSWKKHTLFVVFRDCHSVCEARGLNPGCGYDQGRVLGLEGSQTAFE
jgi:hypothetical protein